MKPHQNKPIQTKWLVLPTLPSLILFSIIIGGGLIGVAWNPHGGGALLISASFLFAIIGFLFESVLVPKSVLKLVQYPELRTTKNLVIISYSSCFSLAILAWIIAALLSFS